jgi:hypothetical protein
LVEEHETNLKALRETLNAAIEEGGDHTSSDVDKSVRGALDLWVETQTKGK